MTSSDSSLPCVCLQRIFHCHTFIEWLFITVMSLFVYMPDLLSIQAIKHGRGYNVEQTFMENNKEHHKCWFVRSHFSCLVVHLLWREYWTTTKQESSNALTVFLTQSLVIPCCTHTHTHAHVCMHAHVHTHTHTFKARPHFLAKEIVP